jgi:16S rRNA (uracil1498-N3)-methyltransferase
LRRFYITTEQLNSPAPFISGDEARHLLRVLRLKSGDRVTLFDNSGLEYQAGIGLISDGRVHFEIIDRRMVNRESNLLIGLGLPLIRPQPVEWILQKGTELGVASFRPFYSTHSRQNFKKTETSGRRERWQRIIREAAKQCGRNVLPELFPALSFSELLEEDRTGLKIIPFEGEAVRTLKDIEPGPASGSPVLVLVGPEGGFPKEEVRLAEEKGFVPVSLGPRILRSETAALALICLLQFRWGDMG